MNVKPVISAALVCGLAVSGASFAGDSKMKRKTQATPKIVGGGPASMGERPWMTSLQWDGEHFCGASLIAPDWVLTAAHCVEDIPSADMNSVQVKADFIDLNNSSQATGSGISQIFIHHDYNQPGKPEADIALVRLASPIENVATVELADQNFMESEATPGTLASVSGWGVLAEDGDMPRYLQEVEVPLVSNATCNADSAYAGEVADTEMCAGYRSGGKDSCQGDSGGPLVVNSSGAFVQAGVVSWGDGCAQANKYGVYSRVASFRAWIDGVMSGDTDGGTDSGGGSNTDGGPLSNGIVVKPLSAGMDEELLFTLEVPERAKILFVDIRGGSGDADLMMAHDVEPSWDYYDYAPFKNGNREHVLKRRPAAGTWYIKLYGYDSFSDVELVAFTR